MTMPPRGRFTVTHKIIAGLAVIIVIGMLSMLLIYRGLTVVEDNAHRLAAVEAPINAAAYEMELNVNGMGFATLQYLATGLARFNAMARNDEADFAHYHATYLRLVKTARERALGEQVGRIYPRFKALGRDLIVKRRQADALFFDIAFELEQIDRVFDDELAPALGTQGVGHAEQLEKGLVAANMEAEAAEVGFWLSNYQRRPTRENKREILEKLEEFEDALKDFRELRLTAEESRQAARLQNGLDGVSAAIERVVSLEDYVDSRQQRFVDMRSALDDLFDEGIQVLALRGLDAPRQEAESAAREALVTMRYLIPIYVLVACAIGLLLVSLIIRPLRRLKAGTEAIGAGDLTHRIEPGENDEFGDLADQFNRMVEQLQATTVSKGLLEDSEAKLHQTVASLRHQIKERRRSEEAREALQAELRRTETMTAMGSLVAGVAHEVRNPLFGISSTLDAMRARLGDRDEYRRYLDVLRSEANRLNQLMADLLDYGKPVAQDLQPGSLYETVAEAAEKCAPLAQRLGVPLTLAPRTEAPPIRFDGGRLDQVFQNLIANALQHSPKGQPVELQVKVAPGRLPEAVDCVVMDSGPGIAEEDLPKVFDPFFTRRNGGTGLGLAIAQRIVAEHGGRIFAGNRPEGGAIFTVRMPVDRSDQPDLA